MNDAGDRFPAWLELTMRARGMSQAQLARSMGVGETQVSRLGEADLPFQPFTPSSAWPRRWACLVQRSINWPAIPLGRSDRHG